MKSTYLLTYDYFGVPLSLEDFDIYQIGRTVCSENELIANHYHSAFYELTFVKNGEGIIYTNNRPVNVKAGDIYLSCPHDIHAIRSDGKNPLHYDFCAFYPKDEKLQKDLSDLSALLSSEKSRLFVSEKVENLLPLALSEIQGGDFNMHLLNGLFWQMSVYTMRILGEKDLKVKDSINDKEVLCYKIMDYITTNIYELDSLKRIADRFNFSYNYLSKIFRQVTSMNLIEFYNMQRLTIAKRLITENKMKLEDVAEKTNFSSAFALSKAFKQYFKVSPAKYKKVKPSEQKTDLPTPKTNNAFL